MLPSMSLSLFVMLMVTGWFLNVVPLSLLATGGWLGVIVMSTVPGTVLVPSLTV